MAKETLEELRERLLRQHNVQEMIQVRAYEIYQMRGGHPGREAQDWFHAESEVLAFLLADESGRADDQAGAEAVASASGAASADQPLTTKPRSTSRSKSSEANPAAPKKPAAKRATPGKPAQPKSKPTRAGSKSKTEKPAD
jgi:hypothetical protein